jgi:hypothetical protein
VFALDPGKVIDKVVYRDVQDGGIVFGGEWADSRQYPD